MNQVVDIQELNYTYPDGNAALRAVSLQITAGEKVALLGPNGAGKSTLLLHLNGILTGSGKINICGLELNKTNLGRIRALVGLVFQNPDDQLFSPTVNDDVAYGPLYMGLAPEEVERRTRQALAAVHMEGFAPRMPYHLSSGEKKRIAIATVLSMQPEILVLDEPSAGLDPRARRELISLLTGLPQTLLLATHDMALVRELAQRAIVMDRGEIVANGVTGEILAKREVLAEHGLE